MRGAPWGEALLRTLGAYFDEHARSTGVYSGSNQQSFALSYIIDHTKILSVAQNNGLDQKLNLRLWNCNQGYPAHGSPDYNPKGGTCQPYIQVLYKIKQRDADARH